MAKHNYVSLYGQVLRSPVVSKDAEGNRIRAMCPILVIRGVRNGDSELRQVRYDKPIIMTSNPKQMERMEQWNAGDMVSIKGAITTKGVKKTKPCPCCGAVNKKDGVIVHIAPIYSKVIEKDQSREGGAELLRESNEVSNVVHIVGNLCNDPLVFRTANNTYLSTYEVAINRTYRIQDDKTDAKTDYPWVKSYGSVAVADARALRKGSLIYVDGFLQTRSIEKNHICEHCGEPFKWPDSSMEIVPYATEYLRNYKTAEEIEAEEQEKHLENMKEIFSENDVTQALRPSTSTEDT